MGYGDGKKGGQIDRTVGEWATEMSCDFWVINCPFEKKAVNLNELKAGSVSIVF